MSTQTDLVTDLLHGEWATRFVDSITITDLTDRGTFSRITGQFGTPTSSEIYAGNALIRAKSDKTTTRGEQGEVLYTHTVMVPHDTNGVGVGNTVTVVTSVLDTDLAGSVMTVQSIHVDSYNTRRELRCLLSQGGGDRG